MGMHHTKARILGAAARAFGRDTFATVEDVAREAGARKSIIHYHFTEGKAELLRELFAFARDNGAISPGLWVAFLAHAKHDDRLAYLITDSVRRDTTIGALMVREVAAGL